MSVLYGDEQTFEISPDDNYHVEDVLVDGSSVGAVSSYEFTNVTGGHTIEATFAIISSTWYLAEGSTAGGMETWVLIQNPNPNPVGVSLALMTDTGQHMPNALQDQVLAGNSRL